MMMMMIIIIIIIIITIIIIIIIIIIIHLLLLLLLLNYYYYYYLYIYLLLSLWLWQSNSVLILIHHFNSNFDCNICCFSRLELLSKPFKWYSIFFSTLFLVLVYVRPSSKAAPWDKPLYHLWTHLRSSHCIHHQRPETKKFSIVFMRWDNLCKDNRSLPARFFFKKGIKIPFNRVSGT